MRYVMVILCFIMANIFLFDLKEVENINGVYASIYFLLAYLCSKE